MALFMAAQLVRKQFTWMKAGRRNERRHDMCKSISQGGLRCAAHTRGPAREVLDIIRRSGTQHVRQDQQDRLAQYAATAEGAEFIEGAVADYDARIRESANDRQIADLVDQQEYLRQSLRQGAGIRAAALDTRALIKAQNGGVDVEPADEIPADVLKDYAGKVRGLLVRRDFGSQTLVEYAEFPEGRKDLLERAENARSKNYREYEEIRNAVRKADANTSREVLGADPIPNGPTLTSVLSGQKPELVDFKKLQAGDKVLGVVVDAPSFSPYTPDPYAQGDAIDVWEVTQEPYNNGEGPWSRGTSLMVEVRNTRTGELRQHGLAVQSLQQGTLFFVKAPKDTN